MLKTFRNSLFKMHCLTDYRMNEGRNLRLEKHTPDRIYSGTAFLVARYAVTQVFHVDPDVFLASGFRFDGKQGIPAVRFDGPVMRDRFIALSRIGT